MELQGEIVDTAVTVIRYGFSLVYGEVLVGIFAGIFRDNHGRISKKNCVIMTLTLLGTGLFQCLLFARWGYEFTLKTYPVTTHLPVLLVLIFLCGCRPVIAFLSIFMSYMALQAPNWLSKLIRLVYSDPYGIIECCIYVVLVVVFMYFIEHYFAVPVRDMMKGYKNSAKLFMILPAAYYFFDYFTTVWTDVLYRGEYLAVQFMPFMMCVSHLLFALYYSIELRMRAEVVEAKSMLEGQMKLAESEFDNMRELNRKARIYRHDMRHHFALIKSMAEAGEMDELREYVAENLNDLESITPRRFCGTDMLNMVLTHHADKADSMGVVYSFDVKEPERTPLTNTEICSMVSNALENALNALSRMPLGQRSLKLMLGENAGKILFRVENTFNGEVCFEKGLPANHEEGHGYGTRSIAAIAAAHGGRAEFTAENGIFSVRVFLPQKEEDQ